MYSFGVVVLEVLSNLPAMAANGEDLLDTIARRLRTAADSDDPVDSDDSDEDGGGGGETLAGICSAVDWPAGVADRLYELALRCTHRRPRKRPVLREIITDLRQVREQRSPIRLRRRGASRLPVRGLRAACARLRRGLLAEGGGHVADGRMADGDVCLSPPSRSGSWPPSSPPGWRRAHWSGQPRHR